MQKCKESKSNGLYVSHFWCCKRSFSSHAGGGFATGIKKLSTMCSMDGQHHLWQF